MRAQIRLCDPDGFAVRDLWGSKSLTVEVVLDGRLAAPVPPPEVPPRLHFSDYLLSFKSHMPHWSTGCLYVQDRAGEGNNGRIGLGYHGRLVGVQSWGNWGPGVHSVHVPSAAVYQTLNGDGIGCTCRSDFHQVPKDAAPVRVEVQISSAPLQATLDQVEKGCLDCGDAKVLLGLRPDAEVRTQVSL